MTDVIEGLLILRRLVNQLDQRSEELAQTSRDLEPVQREYQDFIDAYELVLVREAEEGAAKVPPAALRQKLALEAMRQREPKALQDFYELTAKQERLERRCQHLGKQIDGWRTVASYEKTIAEAT